MDPLSLATSGTALVSVCITIANVLRTIIETHKSCPQELRYLLSRAAGLSIQLHQVDAAKLNLSPVQSAYIGQIFDEEACRKTVHELNDLVWKIHKARSEQGPEEALKKPRVVTTMKWFLNKPQVDRLLMKLREHQQDIFMAVTTITMQTSLGTNADTKAILHDNAGFKADLASLAASFASLTAAPTVNQSLDTFLQSTEPVSAFPIPPHPPANLNTHPSVYLQNQQQTPGSLSRFQCQFQFGTWHGATRSLGRSTPYTEKRKELSDAAYYHWQSDLHAVLNYARIAYNQDWINCIRLAPGNELVTPSGYTPIHQAAWYGVSVEEVQRFLDLGAWRTLRTIESDDTPLDIARKFRHTHLYDILAPVIRHPLPNKTILQLEKSLHDIIQAECESNEEDIERMGKSATRYPEVTVLTEMVIPLIWFPINEEDVNPRGFFIRLDGREIVVKSPYDRQFRISANGTVRKIAEAVVWDGNGV
ncbi:hypothetical protein B0H13DRAFT_2543655 [Mycena leptocephala]|nr:hypothetical protein B0H13DRAFT_2543655 [Mycena leptocephala]